MDELKTYLTTITNDCIKNIPNISLTELSKYACLLLSAVYDKKQYDKDVFEHWVKQLIAQLFIDKFGNYYNNFKIVNNSKQVLYLQSIPVIEQRSIEWYKIKEDSIGASECATIFGDNPYQTKNQLILKKCGHKEDDMIPSIHINHGVKYEPIIQQIYQELHNTKLFEFGSIKHPKYSMISASPDGITPDGVMIEIKAPLSRTITGIPPKYYWYQMQQQLQVCGLDKVDFVECKISEYHNFDEYKKDFYTDPNEPFTSINKHKGVLIVCIDLQVPTEYKPFYYVYPDHFLKTDEIPSWLSTQKRKIENEGRYMFSTFIYWKLDIYSLTEVWRDDECSNSHIHLYLDIWIEGEHYRLNGIESLLVKKTSNRTYKPKVTNCDIDSDNDFFDAFSFKFDYDYPDDIKSYMSDDDNGIDCNIMSSEDDIKPTKKITIKKSRTVCNLDSDDDKPNLPTTKSNKTIKSKNTKNKCVIDSDDD